MSGDLRTRDGAFAAWVAGLTVAVTVIGFSRSFFLLPFFQAPPSWAAHEPAFFVHGAVFAAWFVLLGVQVTLIRSRDLQAHRRLGYLGAGLAVLVVIMGSVAALRAANRPSGFVDVPVPPDQFLALPLLAMVLFPIFVGLAVLWRRDPARHKRLMLLASISLIGAPLARISSMTQGVVPYLDLLVYAALVGVMVVWDVAVWRRPRPETLIGGAAIVVLNAVAAPFGGTAVWLSIAHPLMSLVSAP